MRTVSGLLVTVSLLLCLKANAQHKTFTLQINDIAAIPAITQNYPEVTLNFADPGLTTIASHYHIYNFEQAAPEAPTEHMRQLWLVEVDSLGLMNELLAYDPQLFPWADTPTIATSTAVPPNDPLFGNQGELSYGLSAKETRQLKLLFVNYMELTIYMMRLKGNTGLITI